MFQRDQPLISRPRIFPVRILGFHSSMASMTSSTAHPKAGRRDHHITSHQQPDIDDNPIVNPLFLLLFLGRDFNLVAFYKQLNAPSMPITFPNWSMIRRFP